MSNTGELKFVYGSYEHPLGEVYPRKIEIIPEASQRGVRWASRYRMEVAGNIVQTGTTELTAAQVGARIAGIQAAYESDYQDAGFKYSDDSWTPHKMTNGDAFNLSGNHVTKLSWDTDAGATEFANTRSFTIVIESLFMQSYNPILFFSERVQRIGNGGEVWSLFNLWDGTPVKETIFTTSKIYHVQRGTIVGLLDWPSPPPPLWPDDEHQEKRIVIQGSPDFHGDLNFIKGTHYPVQYVYYYERSGTDGLTPNPWYNG